MKALAYTLGGALVGMLAALAAAFVLTVPIDWLASRSARTPDERLGGVLFVSNVVLPVLLLIGGVLGGWKGYRKSRIPRLAPPR